MYMKEHEAHDPYQQVNLDHFHLVTSLMRKTQLDYQTPRELTFGKHIVMQGWELNASSRTKGHRFYLTYSETDILRNT